MLLALGLAVRSLALDFSNGVDLGFFDEAPGQRIITNTPKLQKNSTGQRSGAHTNVPAKAIDAYNQGHYRTAFRLLNRQARTGHVDSQYRLANLYLRGEGVTRNNRQAAYWYQQAAANGHPLAQHRLANLYHKGIGVGQNMIKAFQWHTRAARAGHPGSINWIRRQFQRDL